MCRSRCCRNVLIRQPRLGTAFKALASCLGSSFPVASPRPRRWRSGPFSRMTRSTEAKRHSAFSSMAMPLPPKSLTARRAEVQGDGRPTIGSNPLGLAFRLDYQLAKQMDLSAIVDASGSSVGSSGSVAGRSLSISWVALKYYWTVDNSDYAFRLAVDPSLDGRTGFSQTDFAFFANTLLSPIFSHRLRHRCAACAARLRAL